MANADRPKGFYPLRHLAGGIIRSNGIYTIASTYGTSIFRGDAVKLVAGGTLEAAAAGDVILGVFDGVTYTDSTGAQIFSPYWPSGTTATDIVASVYDDPYIAYGIQVDGTIAATEVGACADIVAGAGSATTGNSGFELSASTGSSSAQCKILGLVPDPENAWGANVDVIVTINESFLKATAGI